MIEKKIETRAKLTDRAKAEIECKISRSKVKSPVVGLSFGNEKYKNIHTGIEKKIFTGWMIDVFDENQFEGVNGLSYVETDIARFVLISPNTEDAVADKTIDFRDGHFYVE